MLIDNSQDLMFQDTSNSNNEANIQMINFELFSERLTDFFRYIKDGGYSLPHLAYVDLGSDRLLQIIQFCVVANKPIDQCDNRARLEKALSVLLEYEFIMLDVYETEEAMLSDNRTDDILFLDEEISANVMCRFWYGSYRGRKVANTLTLDKLYCYREQIDQLAKEHQINIKSIFGPIVGGDDMSYCDVGFIIEEQAGIFSRNDFEDSVAKEIGEPNLHIQFFTESQLDAMLKDTVGFFCPTFSVGALKKVAECNDWQTFLDKTPESVGSQKEGDCFRM